jgi:hypothetical protein
VKLEVLLNHFAPEYPKTCALYREFSESNNIANFPGAWKLLDCMFFHFAAEITECDEYEIEEFVRHLDSDATLDVARLFAKFMRFASLSKWGYEFYSRGRPEVSNDAYPLSDYAVMAYCAFNDEMWIRQNLIAKAVGSAQFADLWLFTALCFVCALRSTDLTRLPAQNFRMRRRRCFPTFQAGHSPTILRSL